MVGVREDCKISVLLPQGAPPSSDQSAGLTSRSSHLVDGDGYRAAYGRRLDAGVEHGVVVVAEVHGEPHGERVVEASLALPNTHAAHQTSNEPRKGRCI